MTLADLLLDLQRRAQEAEQVGAQAPVAAVLAMVIDKVRALDGNGASAPPPSAPAPEDRLLTVEQAAGRMGVSVPWLYRHARRLPFARRLGARTLRFSEASLTAYLARR